MSEAALDELRITRCECGCVIRWRLTPERLVRFGRIEYCQRSHHQSARTLWEEFEHARDRDAGRI